MGHGLDLQRHQVAGAAHADGIVILLHGHACQLHLCGDGLQMLGDHVLDEHVAPGDGGSHHVAAGLDLVRDDGIGAAVHALLAADTDHVGTRAAHIGTHHVQKVGQVHDVGLLGHVLQHGLALGQHGAEHGVHGGAHRHIVKEHMRTLQGAAAHLDHAVLHRIACAQGTEGLQVLVNGAGTQVAAAGHGDLAGAEPAQQSAQEIVACPHLTGQIVRHLGAVDVGGVDLVGIFIEHPHLSAQGGEDLQRDGHIADGGHVLDHAFIGCQDSGGQNGYHRVLRTADGHFALKGFAPVDNKFLHDNSPLRALRRSASTASQLLYYTPDLRGMKGLRVVFTYFVTSMRQLRTHIRELCFGSNNVFHGSASF